MKRTNIIIIVLIMILVFIGLGSIKAYNYGDEVVYNNMKFNVLKDNGTSVTLLKQRVLLTDEIDYYGYGHVNIYNEYRVGYPSKTYTKSASDHYGYGEMAFYSRKTCSNISKEYSGCVNNYNKSDVKYVVDAWASREFDSKYLVKDELGYSVRLMTKEEIEKYYVFEYREASTSNPTLVRVISSETPSWLYQNEYSFWTMSSADDRIDVYNDTLGSVKVYDDLFVRPVVTIDKAELDRNNGVFKEYTIDEQGFDEISDNKYKTGDVINYKGVRFYVANNNSVDNREISLVKATPLTVSDVYTYGVGYINKYGDSKDTVIDKEGYGAVAYYRSNTCFNGDNKIGCINKYEESDIKNIVDNWSRSIFNSSQLNITDLNMKFRVINDSDLYTMGYKGKLVAVNTYGPPSYISAGVYSDDINLSQCWSTISYGDDNYRVGAVDNENKLNVQTVYSSDNVICPVITIKKNPLPNIELSEELEDDKNIVVNVPDTKLYKNIIVVVLGLIIIGLTTVLIIIKKKSKRRIKLLNKNDRL